MFVGENLIKSDTYDQYHSDLFTLFFFHILLWFPLQFVIMYNWGGENNFIDFTLKMNNTLTTGLKTIIAK